MSELKECSGCKNISITEKEYKTMKATIDKLKEDIALLQMMLDAATEEIEARNQEDLWKDC